MQAKKISKLKLKQFLFWALFCPIVLSVAAVRADTRYVSDRLIITLRKGQGTGTKIKNLRTDNPVKVLEESGRYLRIRTEEGEEGWVPKQYITTVPPKATIIAELKQEIGRLKAMLGESSMPPNTKLLTELTQESKQLKARLKELEKERDFLSENLRAAKQNHKKQIAGLESKAKMARDKADRTFRELKQVNEKKNTLFDKPINRPDPAGELEKVTQENQRLRQSLSKTRRPDSGVGPPKTLWLFLTGAAVFLLGLISGTVLKKKKYYIDF